MTAEMLDGAVILLIYLLGLFVVLAIGGFVADYILPHIPFIERWLDNLPDWDDEDD